MSVCYMLGCTLSWCSVFGYSPWWEDIFQLYTVGEFLRFRYFTSQMANKEQEPCAKGTTEELVGFLRALQKFQPQMENIFKDMRPKCIVSDMLALHIIMESQYSSSVVCFLCVGKIA